MFCVDGREPGGVGEPAGGVLLPRHRQLQADIGRDSKTKKICFILYIQRTDRYVLIDMPAHWLVS